MRNAGDVVSKAEILDNVWDPAYDGDDNVVEVYIGYLRARSTSRSAGTPSRPSAAWATASIPRAAEAWLFGGWWPWRPVW